MFRCRLFETESSNYVFLDIHHTLSDGTSFTLILSNILRALQHQPLEKDYYYLMLSRRERAMESDLYEQGKAYFESTYSGRDWESYPTIDHALTDNKSADLCVELPVTCAQAPEIERKSGVSANEFFMTAAAQSVLDMEISNSEEGGALVLRLDYSASRYEKESMERFGRLFRDAVSSLLAHLGEKGVTCGELKPVL